MIVLLSPDQAVAEREALKNLLQYCKESSSGEIVSGEFCDRKINELVLYLQKKQAFLFAAINNDGIIGFLWACELDKGNTKRFHVLYLAVLPEHQGKGIGKELLEEAEQMAKKMGICQIELNVHVNNSVAQQFYFCHGYCAERIALKKDLA